MEQQNFAVPADLLNAVANYLARQPFADVVQLMAGIQQVRPIEATPPAPPVGSEAPANIPEIGPGP